MRVFEVEDLEIRPRPSSRIELPAVSLPLSLSYVVIIYTLWGEREREREKGKKEKETGCEEVAPVPQLLNAINEIRFKVEKQTRIFHGF